MANYIDKSVVQHSRIVFSGSYYVDAYVVLGVLPRGLEADTTETIFGDNLHLRSHSVVYAGNRIGKGFQSGHGVLIRELNRIGDRVSIGTHSILEHHVTIGNEVRIHSAAFIPEYSVLEDGAWVGPHVVFTNADYPLSPHAKANLRGPHLKRGAKIGANATLLPGVVIGENALVGAGSVVVRDVPDHAVVVGNPARVIGSVLDLPAYRQSDLLNRL